LLRDPSVLILDEPTSALDPTSEAAVTGELVNVLRGRTSLLITHRMSLVEMADMVVVVEDGRILETGSPSWLLSQKSYLSQQFQLARLSPSASKLVVTA
jgi:ATP-binding cassette, subfamily B, bacterial